MSKKQKEESSSSIVTLAGEFKEIKELQLYCDSLYHTLQKTVNENQLLKQENAHMKELLNKTIPIMNISTEQVSDEEVICLAQIQKLKNVSITRELSLDEVKKLDLLYKNLRLCRGESTNIPGKSRDVTDNIPIEDLIQIAGKTKDVDK